MPCLKLRVRRLFPVGCSRVVWKSRSTRFFRGCTTRRFLQRHPSTGCPFVRCVLFSSEPVDKWEEQESARSRAVGLKVRLRATVYRAVASGGLPLASDFRLR